MTVHELVQDPRGNQDVTVVLRHLEGGFVGIPNEAVIRIRQGFSESVLIDSCDEGLWIVLRLERGVVQFRPSGGIDGAFEDLGIECDRAAGEGQVDPQRIDLGRLVGTVQEIPRAAVSNQEKQPDEDKEYYEAELF